MPSDLSQVSNHNVLIWLDALPEATELTSTKPQRQLVKNNKRLRAEDAVEHESPRKNQRLTEISENARMRSSPRKKPPSQDDERRRVGGLRTPLTPAPGRETKKGDPDQTPKPVLQRDLLANHDGASDEQHPSTAKTDSTIASSQSRASSRSQSPQKHLGDTRLSTIPVQHLILVPDNEPRGFSDLIRDCRRTSHGQRVIPRLVEGAFEKIREYLEDYQKNDDPEPASGLSHQAFFHKALEVRDTALECTRRRVSEARWNGCIHYRVLDMALEDCWKAKGVWYEDVTSARISDTSLLASVNGKAIRSKLVDLAIMIDCDETLENRVKEKLLRQASGSQRVSINCTPADYVQFNPIAITIETKREVSPGDPYLQLGIWMTAHFLKLRQMIAPASPLPTMPVISVDGHRWRLMFAYLEPRAVGDRLVILSGITLGSTETVAGIYAIVIALRRLARWVNEEYRPWFETNVLGFFA